MQKTSGNRVRDLGVTIGRFPTGSLNAITDVPGVLVGHAAGITAILPAADILVKGLPASGFVLNGAGEMTGLTQVLEWGELDTPIFLTGSLNVGVAHDTLTKWCREKAPNTRPVPLPVVGECDDTWVLDPMRNRLTEPEARRALTDAAAGEVAEGGVGAGTGMIAFDFKAGIGTSSRRIDVNGRTYTLGCLVLANLGKMRDLRIGGLPMGAALEPAFASYPKRGHEDYGSAIVILATDAPLSAAELRRISVRGAMGLVRVGSFAAHQSGEIAFAFSTNRKTEALDQNPFFEAAVDVVEESVLNSLSGAKETTGREGRRIPGLSADVFRSAGKLISSG